MASTLTIRALGRGRHNGGSGGWGGGGRSWPLKNPAQTYWLGMCFALLSISMLFIGLTSAYVVRQGLGEDWKGIPMPRVLLLNTAILLLSSITIEKARAGLRRANHGSGAWLPATLALGTAFLAGQVLAWRSLAAQGIFLSTNPHSSFFYVLTGLHGIHVAGGLAALAWVDLVPRHRTRWMDVTALYWHFMDGLWIYLLMLLFVWG